MRHGLVKIRAWLRERPLAQPTVRRPLHVSVDLRLSREGTA